MSMKFVQTCAQLHTSGDGDSDEVLIGALWAYLLALLVHYADDEGRASLLATIKRRVGHDHFVDCVESLARQEAYVRAVQRPYVLVDARHADRPLLEHQFARMYRSGEQQLLRALRQAGGHDNPLANGAVQDENSEATTNAVLQSYKELIKRQDAQLAELSAQLRQQQQQLEQQSSGQV